MKVYDNYEISACKRLLDSDAYPPEEYIEVCEEHEAEFWTLYGHIDGEGVEAIGDFRSREAAEQVYFRITGQPFRGSYQADAHLRVMHAGPKLLKALTACRNCLADDLDESDETEARIFHQAEDAIGQATVS